jgi:two-component system response regulator AtoC
VHSVLIIDDEQSIRQSLGYLFRGKGFSVHVAANISDGLKQAWTARPDLVILDNRLPDGTGLQALELIKADYPDMMVIMLTAYANVPDAVLAIRKGAYDYLTKPVDLDALEIAVARALETQELKKENLVLKLQRNSSNIGGIIGSSREIHKLHLIISVLAENPDATVLITGESGTGKELTARTIHMMSSRKEKPFIDINCASLTEHFLESELFGHEKGAFTDAKEMKKGLLEVADGGTIFLDEIAELSIGLQPRLLRVIETKTFRRVGGTRDIKVDVRIMAATNKDISDPENRKNFREDLYYRLCVMPIHMPALRERDKDVLELARHFLSQGAGFKKNISEIDRSCEEYLLAYGWPGNVRELKNVIERAVMLSPGPAITPEHLPRELLETKRSDNPSAPPSSLDEMEKDHIREVMEYAGKNQSYAARLLGISRSTLISKLRRHGLL